MRLDADHGLYEVDHAKFPHGYRFFFLKLFGRMVDFGKLVAQRQLASGNIQTLIEILQKNNLPLHFENLFRKMPVIVEHLPCAKFAPVLFPGGAMEYLLRFQFFSESRFFFFKFIKLKFDPCALNFLKI